VWAAMQAEGVRASSASVTSRLRSQATMDGDAAADAGELARQAASARRRRVGRQHVPPSPLHREARAEELGFRLARDDAGRARARHANSLAFVEWWVAYSAACISREARRLRRERVEMALLDTARAAMRQRREAAVERQRAAKRVRDVAVDAALAEAGRASKGAQAEFGRYVRQRCSAAGDVCRAAEEEWERFGERRADELMTGDWGRGWADTWAKIRAMNFAAGTHWV
jgi:hypothetical protein